MGGYVGSSKKDIECLIDSVQEPGVSVRREIRIKRPCSVMAGPNILYHFYKDGERLFSVCVSPKGKTALDGAEHWANIEMLIVCNNVASDLVCEGDDAYRKACVLYQLAEKMYESQRCVKKLQKQQSQLQIQVVCDIVSRKK